MCKNTKHRHSLCMQYTVHGSAGFPSSKDVSFAEVSCVDGNGMKQLRNKLKELIDK